MGVGNFFVVVFASQMLNNGRNLQARKSKLHLITVPHLI